MKRRKLIYGGGTTLGFFGLISALAVEEQTDEKLFFGDNDNQSEDVPEDIQELEPLASNLKEDLNDTLNELSVYITPDKRIVVHYYSDAESEDKLMVQYEEISKVFVDQVESLDIPEENIPTLSMIATNMNAILPKTGTVAYINDEINRDALLETIEIVGAVEQ